MCRSTIGHLLTICQQPPKDKNKEPRHVKETWHKLFVFLISKLVPKFNTLLTTPQPSKQQDHKTFAHDIHLYGATYKGMRPKTRLGVSPELEGSRAAL